MGNINSRINEWSQEKISKFLSYVKCKMEDRRFFKRYGLDYAEPNGEEVKEVLYEKIIQSKKITKYFFSHVDGFLSLNPSY